MKQHTNTTQLPPLPSLNVGYAKRRTVIFVKRIKSRKHDHMCLAMKKHTFLLLFILDCISELRRLDKIYVKENPIRDDISILQNKENQQQ